VEQTNYEMIFLFRVWKTLLTSNFEVERITKMPHLNISEI
ncbi:MAG: hypothetical protein ACI845_003987, partial [Gammaproteobacteria bacterium]